MENGKPEKIRLNFPFLFLVFSFPFSISSLCLLQDIRVILFVSDCWRRFSLRQQRSHLKNRDNRQESDK